MNVVICATQRSGSTMVCDDFISTGILGNPKEYFDSIVADYRAKKILPSSDDLNIIKNASTSVNSVSAVKVMANQFSGIGNIYKDLGLVEGKGALGFYEFYKDSIWIKLVRRDSVGQAISRYVAKETNIYHVSGDDKKSRISSAKSSDSYKTDSVNFDFEKIDKQVKSIARENSEWDVFFEEFGISPIEIYYEDIVDDRSYLCEVAEKLDLELNIDDLQGRSIKKMAGSKSEGFKEKYFSIADGLVKAEMD